MHSAKYNHKTLILSFPLITQPHMRLSQENHFLPCKVWMSLNIRKACVAFVKASICWKRSSFRLPIIQWTHEAFNCRHAEMLNYGILRWYGNDRFILIKDTLFINLSSLRRKMSSISEFFRMFKDSLGRE